MSACESCGHDPDDDLTPISEEMIVLAARKKLLAKIEAGEFTAKELSPIVVQGMKNEELRLKVKLAASAANAGGGDDDLVAAARKARELAGEGGQRERRPAALRSPVPD